MTEFKSVLDATSQLVSQILNLVGLVEKNQASFENLQNRYQKKRSKRVLEELLMQLVGHRTMNRMALNIMHLAEGASMGKNRFDGDLSIENFSGGKFGVLDWDLQAFLDSVLKIRDFMEKNHKELILNDYRLYEAASKRSG
ncbi:hypothetical protein [Rhizobium favelukesii]|uniref:hypothetical protein n=2 Tax=Rhizobium TaxID=379 RepID=UPI00215F3F5B|nr:hypothetical protein [Rhizobium favelukesii]MCS0463777.1 hypothetical protein [Rhizobium favelukesii]